MYLWRILYVSAKTHTRRIGTLIKLVRIYQDFRHVTTLQNNHGFKNVLQLFTLYINTDNIHKKSA